MSIESELERMAGQSGLDAALKYFGIDVGEKPSTRIIEDWHQGGAESFLVHFEIEGSSGSVQLVLKALVGLGGGLTSRLNDMLVRRSLLDHQGVRSARLYGAKAATILEEYVPLSLSQALRSSHDEGLLHSILYTAFALDALGFVGYSLFDDMRSHGDDAVMVDFGSDLGSPGHNTSHQPSLRAASDFIRHQHTQFNVNTIDSVRLQAKSDWELFSSRSSTGDFNG